MRTHVVRARGPGGRFQAAVAYPVPAATRSLRLGRFDLDNVKNLLDALYSSQDPIYYRGNETDPADLIEGTLPHGADPKRVMIAFYGGPVSKLYYGSLMDMVKDRLRFGVGDDENKREEAECRR